MRTFNIKDVENLSGIKAHTWRIWEQRYGLGFAQRKDSNHRFFDNDNLKQILRISCLYNHGLKISAIAALEPEELKAMALSKSQKENVHEFYLNELIEAAIDLDEEKFEYAYGEAIKETGIENTILKIINPFQERIGVLWLTDHLIPAQEHFTSNIIRQKVTNAIDDLPYVKTTQKKEILLFAPENERHELPLQFIHYLLKKNLNKVIYLGCNASLGSLKLYNQTHSTNYLWFHLITNLSGFPPNEYLRKISEQFPDKQIIMSGAEVAKVTQTPKNVRLLKSMNEIVDLAYQ
jgi:DNA-binding transcriptional MerR regulator